MPQSRPPRPPSAANSANTPNGPNPAALFRKRGADLIRKVSDKDRFAIFLEPVNLREVDGYSELIARPMDLETLQKNLDKGVYRAPLELKADLDLIWSNCCTFNDDNSIFFKEAVRLRALAARYYDDLVRLLTRDGVADTLAQNAATSTPLQRGRQSSSSAPASPMHCSPSQQSADPSRRRARPSRARAAIDAARAEVEEAAKRLAAAEYAAGLSAAPPPPPPQPEQPDQQQKDAQKALQSADSAALPSVLAPRTHPSQQQPASQPSAPAQQARPPVPRSPPPPPAPPRRTSLSAARSLRARAAAHPEAWRAIGRWHGGVVSRAPFLSAARAHEARAARAYARWVDKSAPTARRLLATVLDATAVRSHDVAALQQTTGGKRPRATAGASGCARLLRETLGEERVQKMMKRPDVLLPEPATNAPAKASVSRLRTLLKQKGVDASFVNVLAADDNAEPRAGMDAPAGSNASLAAAGDPDESARAAYNRQMGALLNANYETMMNVLRLRALRSTVPEAVREDVEDRERECVESVANGLGIAVKHVTPRLLVHPVDVAESMVSFVGGTSTKSDVANAAAKR